MTLEDGRGLTEATYLCGPLCFVEAVLIDEVMMTRANVCYGEFLFFVSFSFALFH